MTITLKINNQSLIIPPNNFVLHMHIKYINIQHHYIQNKVKSKRINSVYTPAELILAES